MFNVKEQEYSRPPGLEEETFFPQEGILSSVVAGDLKFDRKRRKWVQKTLADKRIECVPIVLDVCGESWSMLGSKA